MTRRITIICVVDGQTLDVSIPLDIQADALIRALYKRLGQTVPEPAYIRCENPVVLMAGQEPVAYFGLHEGSILFL